MGFSQLLAAWPEERVRELIGGATPGDVTRALERDHCHPEDLAALLSTQAAPRLEEMARLSHRLTRQHFGRTIALFVPLYLSNTCRSDCTYCGYARGSGIGGSRRTLKYGEIRTECETLTRHGFQNILLLTHCT